MTGVRVRTIRDCNVIFHAVTLGILPLVSRRLSIEERRAIHSGCIFVWEERTPTLEAAAVCLFPCCAVTMVLIKCRTALNGGPTRDDGVLAA